MRARWPYNPRGLRDPWRGSGLYIRRRSMIVLNSCQPSIQNKEYFCVFGCGVGAVLAGEYPPESGEDNGDGSGVGSFAFALSRGDS